MSRRHDLAPLDAGAEWFPDGRRGEIGLSMGAGPTVVALLTDRVFHDDNMLRYSLMITCTSGYLVSALLWRVGLGPFRRTVEQAEALRS